MKVAQEVLQVCKKFLQVKQMSAVESARAWSRDLVQQEAKGSGDTENAMRRLGERYGVPWRTFWSLRYRPPKSMCADVWLRIRGAYQAECERQIRKLQHEIEITETIAGRDHAAVAKARALVGEAAE